MTKILDSRGRTRELTYAFTADSELQRLSWFCGNHQYSQYHQGTGGSSRSSSSSCSSDSERRSVPPNLLAMISAVPGSVEGVGETV